MRRFALWMVAALCLIFANHALEMRLGTPYDIITDAWLIIMLADRFADWILKDGRKEDEHD